MPSVRAYRKLHGCFLYGNNRMCTDHPFHTEALNIILNLPQYFASTFANGVLTALQVKDRNN